MAHTASRNSIFPEVARILAHQAYAGSQYVLRLAASKIAAHATPGSFVHIKCHSTIPMRRPMSIMRAEPKVGWIEILYKAHGEGTRLLASHKVDDALEVLGPIGVPFKLADYRRKPLLIGGGVGIPPMIFLAEHLCTHAAAVQPLVIMGSEIPFPFTPRPSRILVPGVPADTIACMPLLEDWGIASRLCSLRGQPGCYEGYVTDLARHWLRHQAERQRSEVEIFACGPTLMLQAVAQLAHEFALPCQLSLEEYMACAVGGCAGCTVEVQTQEGPAMRRVCVDGPVFEAREVYPPGR
jgi:dihydroorotate dehydrogenase electron transfer subunit